MNFSAVKLIYFSPTQTTRRILQGIAQGMSINRIEHFNLTTPRSETQSFEEIDQLTILGAPVYVPWAVSGRPSVPSVKGQGSTGYFGGRLRQPGI